MVNRTTARGYRLFQALGLLAALSISTEGAGQSTVIYEGTATVRSVSNVNGLLLFFGGRGRRVSLPSDR